MSLLVWEMPEPLPIRPLLGSHNPYEIIHFGSPSLFLFLKANWWTFNGQETWHFFNNSQSYKFLTSKRFMLLLHTFFLLAFWKIYNRHTLYQLVWVDVLLAGFFFFNFYGIIYGIFCSLFFRELFLIIGRKKTIKGSKEK